MKNVKKKSSKLAIAFVLGFLILGLLICVVSSFIGYTQYKSGIEKQYNDKAYEIAEVAKSMVPLEELEEYKAALIGYQNGTVSADDLAKMREDESYLSVDKNLSKLAKGMGSNDIYFAYIDKEILNSYNGSKDGWMPLKYIFDNYAFDESYTLGSESPCNPKNIDSVNFVLDNKTRADDYFISNGDFGYITSAILPVLNENNEVVCCIGVETPMTTIETSLRRYVVYAVLTTVLLIICIIAVYMFFLFRRVIRPINKISSEVGGFIENNNEVSKNLETIKTGDEIEDLAQNVLKMQLDINDYIKNITKITAEKERIGAELDVATHIQASMLPCIFPAFPDRSEFDIYATMTPAKEVGGDFYDFFMMDDRHLAIVMADVSGKGVPAALFMVIGKTLIKDHTSSDTNLGEVFSVVNNLLCQSNSEGLFITAFEGVLDLVTGEFTFVNAGHEMPYIYRKGGDFEAEKIKAGFVLGGMESIKYSSGSFTLNPGDKIFQYTDGVTEATNKDNELFGMERLSKSLSRVKDGTPFDILPAVKKDIDEFVGEAPQFDDITMLALEYKEKMEEK